jgi:uncharacterized membrane protein YfcA
VPPETLPLFAIGVAAGVIGALLGIGGGLLIVPALSLLAGLPLRSAVAASLVCVCATSVASSVVYLRRGRVRLSLAIELQFFAVLGAVGAGLVAGLVPVAPLFFAFAALLWLTAGQMWPAREGAGMERMFRRAGWPRSRVARGASVGAGILSGLLGVGGGILNTPVLHLVVGLAFEQAVATSVYMIGMTAAAGALVYYARGDMLPAATVAAMLGTLAGALPAAWAGHRIGARGLRMAFSLFMLIVSLLMVRRGIAEL